MSINVLDTIYFDYAFFQSDREGKLKHVYDISGIDGIWKVVTSSDQVWILVGEEDPLIGRDFTIYNIDL